MLPNEAADRFSNRAEDYEKYRPSYPPEVLDALERHGALSPQSVVADIGSGTGILTRQLAPRASMVYAIEPNREMRKASLEPLRQYENVIVLEGRSENTGLPEQCVDLVIAAQSYHWFDRYWTLEEWHRILKEDGYAALIWNERRTSGDPFLEGYENLLVQYGTDYRQVDHRHVERKHIEWILDADTIVSESYSNKQELDFDGLKGRLLSSSYMPKEEDERFDEMIEALRSLFDEHSDAGTVTLVYDTNLYLGRLAPLEQEEDG